MSSINPRDAQIDLSIIIISYNTAQVTRDCLNSIYRSFAPQAPFTFEIIVIDNASTDNSVETIQNYQKAHPEVKLTANKENIGFGRANNQGVKQAQGKYILFLNSDTVVLENAIFKLYQVYTEDFGSKGFVGGKLLNQDMTPQPSCGPFYTPAVVFGALFLKGDYWGFTRSSPDEPKKIDWVSGACIFTTKETFEKVGGFDEQIFMYMEEIDLLYRAKKLGYNTYFYSEARFIHLGSVSSGGRTYPILQVYKGFLYFYNKHMSAQDTLLLRIMLQLKAVISLSVGWLTGNSYLKETYAQAYKIASMAR